MANCAHALDPLAIPSPVFWAIGRRSIAAHCVRILAGLTGTVIVLSQGVAFALFAGLPLEYGLYSAIVPAIIAALFWLVLAPRVGPHNRDFHRCLLGAVRASGGGIGEACSAGGDNQWFGRRDPVHARQARTGWARQVRITHNHDRIHYRGAILIITKPINACLWRADTRWRIVCRQVADVVSALDEINLYVLSIALAALLVALMVRYWRPRLPAMLIAMVIATLLWLAFDGAAHGVALVGVLPDHLPFFSPPDLSLATLKQ
jgi:sulfate permease, SulP family